MAIYLPSLVGKLNNLTSGLSRALMLQSAAQHRRTPPIIEYVFTNNVQNC